MKVAAVHKFLLATLTFSAVQHQLPKGSPASDQELVLQGSLELREVVFQEVLHKALWSTVTMPNKES